MYSEDGLFVFLWAHIASSLPKRFLIRRNRSLNQIKQKYFCLPTEQILQSLGLNNCAVAISSRCCKHVFLWRGNMQFITYRSPQTSGVLHACFKKVLKPVGAASPVALPSDNRRCFYWSLNALLKCCTSQRCTSNCNMKQLEEPHTAKEITERRSWRTRMYVSKARQKMCGSTKSSSWFWPTQGPESQVERQQLQIKTFGLGG